ncbi:Ribokinase-like protein [Rhypophila decipiens]
MESNARIKFCSLGMVVLDEIRFPDGQVLSDVPGGSGLYSTLGARIAAPATATQTKTADSKEIGSVVLAGGDFPAPLRAVLRDWDHSLQFRLDPSRATTRGLIQYTSPNFKDRTFRYTTPTLQPTPADLRGDPNLLNSTAFHFLASPQDLHKLVLDLAALRTAEGDPTRPLIIWEPAPASCTPENRDVQIRAATVVDAYSPNHHEFLAVFGPLSNGSTAAGEDAADAAAMGSKRPFDRSLIERHALCLLESGVGPHGRGLVVIRSGEHGCLVTSRSYPARWFPTFHSDPSKVVDVTGAGNTFLGAFTLMLGTSDTPAPPDPTEATIIGSVAASFTIEQIGLPKRGVSDKTMGLETWNGVDISTRIDQYRMKLNASSS